MSLYDDVSLSDVDRKARQVFGENVVVKSLAQQTVFHGLPRYVSEYLIAKYVKPESWKEDLAKVQSKIKDLLPDLELLWILRWPRACLGAARGRACVEGHLIR